MLQKSLPPPQHLRRNLNIICLLAIFQFLALGEEGKVYIKTDPPEADVWIIREGRRDPLGKSPGLFRIPMGKQQEIEITKDGYQTKEIEIDVEGDEIIKPEIIKLDQAMRKVDIIFEEGWEIQVDKQPVLKDGKPVTTPATIPVSSGEHEIKLTKEGYKEISQMISNQEILKTLEIKKKPQRLKLEWTQIVAPEFKIMANKPFDTKIILDGTPIQIIPNPEDRWAISPSSPEVNWEGNNDIYDGLQTSCLCVLVNGKKYKIDESLSIKGRLILMINDNILSDNHGFIRVKIRLK